jgi:hypothetical protein
VSSSAAPDQPLVLVMTADPCPHDLVPVPPRQRPVALVDARRPISSRRLELQRRMKRVSSEKTKCLIRLRLYVFGQRVIACSECGSRKAFHSGVVRPALCSSNASSIRKSSLPAFASRSICSSNLCAMNASNHSRNARRSSIGNSATNFSIVSSLPMQDSIAQSELQVICLERKARSAHG